jgi:hypothetical protein
LPALTSNLLRVTGILLTAVVAFLHVYFALHAGALWRDEAQTVSIAGMNSLAEIWGYLAHGSFPMLWYLVLRFFESLFSPGDFGYRLLGCGVGLGLVATLWLNARQLKFDIPLISVALLGFNPVVLRWGDSVRAYGFGTVLMLLTFAALWRVVVSPSRGNVLLATIVAICSVQATYHNSMLLLGAGVAAMSVAVVNGHWKRAAIVAGIGLTAALSMLPYAPSMLARSEWNMIFLRSEFDLPWFLTMAGHGTNPAGTGWVWLPLAVGAILLGLSSIRTRARTGARFDSDRALYCLTTAAVSVTAYFLLFKFMRYPTLVWNYIPLLAVTALALDALWSGIDRSRIAGTGRVMVALAIAAFSFATVWADVQARQTNVDLVAAALHERAGPDDLVLVTRWYYGISFDYYYRGAAPWMSLPPIEDFRAHRYDLVKARMSSRDPLQPVIDAAAQTLKSGHRVYVVGDLIFPTAENPLIVRKPAPEDPIGWDAQSYQVSWVTQMGSLLKRHVESGQQVPLRAGQPVQTYELHRLWVLQGWRD